MGGTSDLGIWLLFNFDTFHVFSDMIDCDQCRLLRRFHILLHFLDVMFEYSVLYPHVWVFIILSHF